MFPKFPMRLLALDLGDRRIGLAVGDSSLGTAFPAGRLQRTKLRADLQLVREAARQREAEGFVVGVPYLPSGGAGHQARMAQGFIRALKQALKQAAKKDVPLPVYEVDEAFTSLEAEALLREAGLEPSRNKGAIDEAAAVLILLRFWEKAGGLTPESPENTEHTEI